MIVPEHPDEESVCELLDCLYLSSEYQRVDVPDAMGFNVTVAIVETYHNWWWSDRSRWETT